MSGRSSWRCEERRSRPAAGRPRFHSSAESRAKNVFRRFSSDREEAAPSGCLAFAEAVGRREVNSAALLVPATGGEGSTADEEMSRNPRGVNRAEGWFRASAGVPPA